MQKTMNLSLQTEELFADNLKQRLDPSLYADDFIEDCLLNTKQLHQETSDSSTLLFYAMLTLGRHTKGSPAVQKFTALYKELGNEECAAIVHSGNYREQDLAFFWSTSQDLSHLFELSSVAPIKTYISNENVRQLSNTIMKDDWIDYAFHEVDKIPSEIPPRHWGLYNVPDATLTYDTAEFAVLDKDGRPIRQLCSSYYQHVYFTEMFRDIFSLKKWSSIATTKQQSSKTH